MITESKILLAAFLYEARDTVKFLLGDKYESRMQEGGAMLTRVAEETGKNVLVVAGNAARQCEKDGQPFGAMAVLAAAVELLEPSGST